MSTEERNQDPEDFLQLIHRQNRGKLKVYLGSSAGVGKTYAMLTEGNRLKKLGLDVVIGYVEPHDRPETAAQIQDLEIIPPKLSLYHNIEVREMDLSAVLRRKATIVLVDEFAHTNVPGSRHMKRYEDVQEILEAGLSVITTLNIQHLESLYNIVESATGIKVKERIPDNVVAEADQLVNVDLPAEDLLERLKAGKIYAAHKLNDAMANFFVEENLTRLREITFSEVANFLDRRQRLSAVKEAKPSAGARVMVAVSSRGANPEARLRQAARLAMQLNGEWYAVYVRTKREATEKMSAETERILTDNLELAQRMGGKVVTLKSDSISAALVSFAKEYGVTHLLMGRPGPRNLFLRFSLSLVEEVSGKLDQVDIVLTR